MNKDQVQEDLIDVVADKAQLIQKYKTEVVKDTKKLNKICNQLKRKIESQLWSDLNPDGLLRGPSDDYLSCLQMNTAGLIRRIEDDQVYWEANLETVTQCNQ